MSLPREHPSAQPSPAAAVDTYPTSRGLALIAVLCVGLHLPTMLTEKMCADEAIYAFVGHQWLHEGKTLYVDIAENKPPGVFLVDGLASYVCGTNIVPARLVALLAHIGVALAVAGLGVRLATPGAGLVAGLFYVLVSAGGSVQGQYALTEVFGLPLVAASMLLAWLYASRGGIGYVFGSGVMAGMALWFKQVYALEFLVVMVFLYVYAARRPSRSLPAVGYLLAGCAVPIGVLVWYLVANDILMPAYQATVLGLLSGGPGVGLLDRIVLSRNLFSALSRSSLLLLLASVGIQSLWVDGGARRTLLLVWLLAALLGVASSGRFYGHYFLQLLPPLCLLAGIGFARLMVVMPGRQERLGRWVRKSIIVGMSAVVFCSFMGSSLYMNRFQPLRRLVGAKATSDIHRQIGEYIRSHSTPSDTIYVEHPTPVYFYADRGSPFPYLNARVQRHDLQDEYLRALYDKQPLFYVNTEWVVPRQLSELIEAHYRPVAGFWGVYERITPAPQ